MSDKNSYDGEIMSFEREVIDRLARIEQKLTEVATKSEDHEDRLRVQEGILREAKGAARVWGFIAGAIPVLAKILWDSLSPHNK